MKYKSYINGWRRSQNKLSQYYLLNANISSTQELQDWGKEDATSNWA